MLGRRVGGLEGSSANDRVRASSRPSATRASMRAMKYAGAIAFSRTGATGTGDFEPAEIIATFGVIPTDLAEIMGLGG